MTRYGKPSGRHERCARGCGAYADVDERGLMPDHTRSTYRIDITAAMRIADDRSNGVPVVGDGPQRVEYTCDGSLKPSQQEAERRRWARVHARDARAAAVREEAAVALDAFLQRHTNAPELTSRLDEMRELALHRMGQRPSERGDKAPRTAWLWGRRSRWKGDVYCVFCGEMLERDVARPLWHRKFELQIGDGPARHGDHLTSCALMVLAGMREPVPPGTKKLPNEFRQDD